jgi:hypothetical protein
MDLLYSVQPEKRIYDLLSLHFPSLSFEVIENYLSSMSSVVYGDRRYRFRSVYTDILQDNVMFLSSKRVDHYHEKVVSHLSSLSILIGLSFKRRPSESRYDGYDLEFRSLNVEFETGLKASYRDLEDRIALSRLPVVIVVPNEVVRERYSNHFLVWDVSVITLSSYSSFVKQTYI